MSKDVWALMDLLLFQQGLALVKSKIRLRLRRFFFEAKCSSWVSVDDWLFDEILLTKKCCPVNWRRRGWKIAIWTSVTDVGSSKECLQRKCISSFVKTCLFFFWPVKSGKAAIDEKEKNKRCDELDRLFRFLHFFQIFGKSFTSSWLRRCLRVSICLTSALSSSFFNRHNH